MLSQQSQVMGGILFLSLVTVESGGAFMVRVVLGRHPATALQTSFFRAGHAHAGVLILAALVAQVFVDATDLSGFFEWVARSGIAVAAILMPAGFFLSVIRPGTEQPNRLVLLLPIGATLLGLGAATLGIGLLAAA